MTVNTIHNEEYLGREPGPRSQDGEGRTLCWALWTRQTGAQLSRAHSLVKGPTTMMERAFSTMLSSCEGNKQVMRQRSEAGGSLHSRVREGLADEGMFDLRLVWVNSQSRRDLGRVRSRRREQQCKGWVGASLECSRNRKKTSVVGGTAW